jgi:hypothetical protein
MVADGKTAPDDVRALLANLRSSVISHYWNTALIVEDGWGGGPNATVVRQDA